MNLADLRLGYTKGGLLESDVLSDPFEQFRLWFEQALSAQLPEPNAMALATVSTEGAPSIRTVLLKSFDRDGFVFYTNYTSRKARDLAANPRASLLFYWAELERQVRISGSAGQTSREESEAYFSSRPIGHQLGAWASDQSAVAQGREALEEQLSAAAKRFEPGPVPLPPFWGGYRVRPHAFEFWQGRANRLHDRIEYVLSGSAWIIRRLSP
jgi:pyridoxamine 5'-phosphate oxidase